jgi:predicted RNA binding protein YcfA (HicA-like mRNA interferase family)
MSKIEKIVQQFLNRPTTLRYSDIEKVLLHLGFEKINAKGSHHKFKNSLLEHDLVIPVHGNDCKDFYKKLAAKTVKQLIKNN